MCGVCGACGALSFRFCRQSDAYADQAVFYKMLRPEIVKEFHVPLSSDAFTGTAQNRT
jgi:hypothetical protein